LKVYVLAPNEDWICDRISSEWAKYNHDITTDKVEDADVIWLLAGWCWNHIPQSILKSKKSILTIHHIVPEKFTQQKHQEFVYRDQFIDAYHVPNSKTASLVKQLTKKPIYIAGYWYDPTMWFDEPKDECREMLSLPSDKFIVGSFQRDSEGGTRNPKLEKGPDLFCDYLEKIKDSVDLHVLLGGWRREYVIDRLSHSNIEYTFIEKASIEQLRMMYNACDLYVVGSRFEGGPQAILEASSTNTPIVSRDVGIASDVLDPYCIIDIPKQIWFPEKSSTDQNYKNVQKYNIINYKNTYIEIFERIK
jgi:glycosyltransferase involved in cell wall biosynthesis